MTLEQTHLRVGVNAAIVRDGCILLVEFDDGTPHYNLPGGGVETGESIYDALHRELREETCCTVLIERLLLVWEYFPPQHDNRYGNRHKLGLVFLCSLTGDNEPRLPDYPDAHQTAVRWLPIAQIDTIPLLPQIGTRLIKAIDNPSENDFITGLP